MLKNLFTVSYESEEGKEKEYDLLSQNSLYILMKSKLPCIRKQESRMLKEAISKQKS